jgi:hypothetical protein
VEEKISRALTGIVQYKLFLYDKKDKKHSNREITLRAWEDIWKETNGENNQ